MFPCGTGPPQKIVKYAYGGLAYFRCVLESRSRIVRCFRIGHLACKEYRIKVVTTINRKSSPTALVHK